MLCVEQMELFKRRGFCGNRELKVGNSNLERGVQMGQQGKLSATTNCHHQAEAGCRMVAWRGQASTINWLF